MIKESFYAFKQSIKLKAIKKKASNIIELSKSIKNRDKNYNNVIASIVAEIKTFKGIDIHVEQIMGVLLLLQKNAIEMKTGEGKTLVAFIAALAYSIMEDSPVTIVTVNDYLTNRDANDHLEIAEKFNKRIGLILKSDQDIESKKINYSCDIIYSSASELGYDYLKDNLVQKMTDKVQGERGFVIIDEIDSVLIDEANEALSIVGVKPTKVIDYSKYVDIANSLEEETHYIINHDSRAIELTEDAYSLIENGLNVGNIFESDEHVEEFERIINILNVKNFAINGVDYIVEDDKIIPIDKNGRRAYGQRFKSTIQQIVEYIENVTITNGSEIIAEITYQNYFRMYKSMAGMSGTLKTEDVEFADLYNLEIFKIPVHFKNVRNDIGTYYFRKEDEKIKFILDYISSNINNAPILIGTNNINDNDFIVSELSNAGHSVIALSAKDSSEESEIIKKAGEIGSIVVATNIAGRGVDIKLTEESRKAGGLNVIGYSRNITRRLDNQLIGRSGRQGDPGKTMFLVSLEDSLIRDFAKGIIKNMISNLIDGDSFVKSEFIDKNINKIQMNIEDMYYESRVTMLKYDNIVKFQRDTVYSMRDSIMTENNFNYLNSYIQEIINTVSFDNSVVISSLNIKLKEEGLRINLQEKDINGEDIVVNKEVVTSSIMKQILDKFAKFDSDSALDIVAELHLSVFDRTWIDLINKTEELRMGINLRSIGQKDPAIEFQKDAFNMFNRSFYERKIEFMNLMLIVDIKKSDELGELNI